MKTIKDMAREQIDEIKNHFWEVIEKEEKNIEEDKKHSESGFGDQDYQTRTRERIYQAISQCGFMVGWIIFQDAKEAANMQLNITCGDKGIWGKKYSEYKDTMYAFVDYVTDLYL